MRWHLFALVWGDDFVRRFVQNALPYLAAPGNLPSLAEDGAVTVHLYTDTASQGELAAGFARLDEHCALDIHLFDPAWAHGLRGTDFKYELQRGCLRDLAAHIPAGEPVVLLDSNFIVSDGTFAALKRRWHQGYRSVSVSVLRVATETFVAPPADRGSRALLASALCALHPMTERFFIEARPFAAYPSQLSWGAGPDAFVNRNILPHPLLVAASRALAQTQSTMDYDLALRSASDNQVYMCADSDEMLVVKFSEGAHAAEAVVERAPSPADLGLFLLTATNRRHRLFADIPVVFHLGDVGPEIETARAASQAFIDEAYAWIDRMAARPEPPDARRLVYLKSHFGTIEEFISPQLESAALARSG